MSGFKLELMTISAPADSYPLESLIELRASGGITTIARSRFDETCKLWKWQAHSYDQVETPMGRIDLTRESKATLLDYAKYASMTWHRERDNRAQSDQGGVAGWPCTMAHQDRIWSGGNWINTAIATGAAPDARSMKEYPCSCGEGKPTRRHWKWHCQDIQCRDSYRTNAEEALALRVLRLPEPPRPRETNVVGELREAIRRAPRIANQVLAATDGGSYSNLAATSGITTCGGIGIALKTNIEENYRYSEWLTGADQRPWAAEVDALICLLRAAKEAEADVHVLIDNKAVCDSFDLALKGKLVLPRFAFGRWRDVSDACVGRNHTTEWVPAHGRMRDWTTKKDNMDSAICRGLNDTADSGASEAAKAQYEQRVQNFDRLAKLAAEWSERAMKRCVVGLTAYLKNHSDFGVFVSRWLDA